jgi:hypothetical protein
MSFASNGRGLFQAIPSIIFIAMPPPRWLPRLRTPLKFGWRALAIF